MYVALPLLGELVFFHDRHYQTEVELPGPGKCAWVDRRYYPEEAAPQPAGVSKAYEDVNDHVRRPGAGMIPPAEDMPDPWEPEDPEELPSRDALLAYWKSVNNSQAAQERLVNNRWRLWRLARDLATELERAGKCDLPPEVEAVIEEGRRHPERSRPRPRRSDRDR